MLYNFGPCTTIDFSYNRIGKWHIKMFALSFIYTLCQKVYDYREWGGGGESDGEPCT